MTGGVGSVTCQKKNWVIGFTQPHCAIFTRLLLPNGIEEIFKSEFAIGVVDRVMILLHGHHIYLV